MSMDSNCLFQNPEIWGGVECTINRIGDTFRDQLLYSGHYARAGDIDRFAQLGLKALRYPVLWEKHQPEKGTSIDWRWTEQQLQQIQKNNITPIAGLVHHGSGPAFTSLCDEQFAQKLAAYAHQVASKFPWLEYYTPVNEPLTTARFSGLYGHWYPHHKDAFGFATILLNQVKAIVLSMQAIRKINPAAKLVQTEDLAKIHSTRLLKYQADFENERRWITYELLCGRVDKHHYLWSYLTYAGIKESTLAFFLEQPCIPDIIGFNYYVTSERYLDENLDDYPVHTHGTNGKHYYADIEAVRGTKPAGLFSLLQEAWQRYQLPMAITEAHLSCTGDEQMRWFYQVWNACCQAKRAGIDIRAVTAWSLLGAWDWDSLLTEDLQHYETGVFDVSNGDLQPTATANLITSLAKHGICEHPALKEKGWWQKESRFIYKGLACIDV
jgi:dTDP-4-dehydrorhamnose reductase